MLASGPAKAAWNAFGVFAFVLGLRAVVEGASPDSSGSSLKARDVIWKFSQGNARIIEGIRDRNFKKKFSYTAMMDKLIEDPLNPVKRHAIVLADSRLSGSVDFYFGVTEPGEVQTVRVAGGVIKRGDRFDGVLSSVEYALRQPKPPPLLLIMANSKNDVVEAAVRLAKGENTGEPWEDSAMVQEILPVARDALVQDPHASFDTLCDTTAKLNVWNTIETMLTTSRTIYDLAKAGEVEVHGAFRDESGKIQFMGEHPLKQNLLLKRPLRMRTAKDPVLPAEQAIAMLVAGNKRYLEGNTLTSNYVGGRRNEELTTKGQSPFAIILGCADARAPPELLFDARPGNLFVLRTAGNTFNAGKTAVLGSAEYAVSHLRSKLIVVMGHTNCGAVTAAVGAAQDNANLKEVPGSIGLVLADLIRDAAHAVTDFPSADQKKQIVEATRFNVFSTIEKIVQNSPIVADGIKAMEVQVHGAVYDIETGEVIWLGQHPNLANILASPVPVHEWKVAPYVRARAPGHSLASPEIGRLKDGNKRFRSGQLKPLSDIRTDPFAIILGGSELRIPLENIFDADPGELVIQKSMGHIAGHGGNALFDSLEYSFLRYQPRLLLVLGASDSFVVNAALNHVKGQVSGFGVQHPIHEVVGSSALTAILQSADASGTAAGREMRQRGLAVELNTFYTVEQLLRHSEVIRNAVAAGELEVHAGILQEDTGKVEFIGMHPVQEDLLKGPNSHSLAEIESDKPPVAQGLLKKLQPVGKLRALLLAHMR